MCNILLLLQLLPADRGPRCPPLADRSYYTRVAGASLKSHCLPAPAAFAILRCLLATLVVRAISLCALVFVCCHRYCCCCPNVRALQKKCQVIGNFAEFTVFSVRFYTFSRRTYWNCCIAWCCWYSAHRRRCPNCLAPRGVWVNRAACVCYQDFRRATFLVFWFDFSTKLFSVASGFLFEIFFVSLVFLATFKSFLIKWTVVCFLFSVGSLNILIKQQVAWLLWRCCC